MKVEEACTTRRRGLAWGGQLLIGVAVASVVGKPQTAHAAKVDKRDFFYQDKPKEGKSCSACRLYSPTDLGKGQCSVVEGDVSPNGWCMAYSPRA